jgi:hypothetical protein
MTAREPRLACVQAASKIDRATAAVYVLRIKIRPVGRRILHATTDASTNLRATSHNARHFLEDVSGPGSRE